MTGLPITLTFTFDDMAKAEAAIAAVRRATNSHAKASEDNGATVHGENAPADSVTGDASRPSRGGGSPADIREQRENVPSQHEVRPGSASLGIEQQCDTLGVTAGETAPHSEMDGGAIAAVKGKARPASVVDAEPSPSSILPMAKPLRPNCQKPDHCSGYGRNHCHDCKVKAATEAEAA